MGLRRHDTLLLTMGPNTLTLILERILAFQLAIVDALPAEISDRIDAKAAERIGEVRELLAGIQAAEDAPADVTAKEQDVPLEVAVKAAELAREGALDTWEDAARKVP